MTDQISPGHSTEASATPSDGALGGRVRRRLGMSPTSCRVWESAVRAHPQAFIEAALCWGALGLLLIGFPIHRSSADDDLSRYYDGLRQRGLYRLAESDGLRRLADEQVTPQLRAELAIELSRTYALHATHRSGQERDELWNRAEQVLAQAEPSAPSGSYRTLLAAQRALVAATQGAQLRWQWELSPLDRHAAEAAAKVLQRALERLRELPTEFEEQSQLVLAGGASTPAPRVFREVQQRVEFQLAAASVDLANVLPTGPERAAALYEAETRLKELVNTPKHDGRAWQAEVLLLRLWRFRGEFDRIEPRVTALLEKEPPAAIRDAAVAELVRSYLEGQHPDAAIERLQAHRREHGWKSDELKSLVVETILAARRVAFAKGQTELARDLLTQAETSAADVAGAWGARSRLQLETARDADVYGPQLAGIVRQATWAWKNGDLDEAIQSYRQATVEAHRSGRAEFAAEFGLTLATLQTESGHLEDAIDALTGLLNSYPESPQAADADLLRAYAQGKQFEQQPDDVRRQAYRAALDHHRKTYATSSTAAEAAWMLARLQEFEHDGTAAVSTLQTIPPDHKRGPAAAQRIGVVYERLLEETRLRGEPIEAIEQQAIADLTSLVERFLSTPVAISSEQAEIALKLARLLLHQEPPEFVRADALLERIVNSGPEDDNGNASPVESPGAVRPALLASAAQLRIVSLAGQGRLDDARRLLAQLGNQHPLRMLEVLNGLTSAAEHVAIQHRRVVSELQLEVSQQLEQQRESLTVDSQIHLDESLAQSYAAIGQVPKAAALYEKLIWQQPESTRLVRALAVLYESCGSPSCLRNALVHWEKLEHRQKKGTADWLDSRFHLAWCSHQLGDDETARKLIGVTTVLYPDMGSPLLKAKFAELSSELTPK